MKGPKEPPEQTLAADFRFLTASARVEVCIRNTRGLRIIIPVVRIITLVMVFHSPDTPEFGFLPRATPRGRYGGFHYIAF